MVIAFAVAVTDDDVGPRGLNRRLFLDMNDFARHTPWLHTPVYLYATYGVLLFGALLVAGWEKARNDGDSTKMAAALWAPAGTLLALAFAQAATLLVAQPRPYASLPHILVLADRDGAPAFLSDHAIMAGAVAGALLLVNRRLGLIAAAAAAVMAICGVYTGAHYPIDVAAGLVLGAVVAVIGYLLLEDLLTHLVQWLATTRLRALLTTAPLAPPATAAEGQPAAPRPGHAGEQMREDPAGCAGTAHRPSVGRSGSPSAGAP
ncbi:MAG: Undecaprenyl-diphosphatase [Actinomycetia bacterium]|nr:Undecaprenyl-diphosphatase [Actinomycetes bacterium]